jgi:hypothetical protein
MARSLRLVCAAIAVLGALLCRPVLAQAPPQPTLIKDSKGCQFVNPFDEVAALGEYVWSGECKDSLVSGSGTLSYPRTKLSWTGDFVAGAMRHGFFKRKDGATYEGDFKNNRQHGQGTLRESDGRTLPDGSKRSIDAEDLSRFGIGS